MKNHKRAVVLLPLLLLLTGAAGWLRQWPIASADQAAEAYRVQLDASVYRHASDKALGDVAVIDAQERMMPAMLFAADMPTAQAPSLHALRWFTLPQVPLARLDLISERDENGRVLSIKAREIKTVGSEGDSWLVDASTLSARPDALLLQFAPEAQFSANMRVEGSNDLKTWWTWHENNAVLQLRQGDERMVQTRIALGEQARYWRLTLQGASVPLQAVWAELPTAPVEPARTWQDYQGRASADRRSFEFEAAGRQPFDRADVLLPGSTLAHFRLESRDDPTQPWQHRAGPWTQYRLGEAARSEAQGFVPVRQRYWRLVADRPIDDAPQLRLGWRPEVLIFIAAGQSPYRLVAGSATRAREDAPLADLLLKMRSEQGANWQPASAWIQGEGEVSDASALEKPRDYKRLLLWGILLLAVLLVGGFAVSLLREKKVHE
ncbi:hypothetical protein CO614_02825 [Lysobacteraceae bacterium NML120232]|nr:hypothetical protein CO614_02825 [Xanthomonadaceae bacterium NML120232]